MSKWIDFKELRAKLDFAQVMRHYGLEVHAKGDQHVGFCPLPNHQGKKNSPSFSANLRRGIFQCFGCGSKGNVLEFAAFMEKIDLRDGSALRKLALRLDERFCRSPEIQQAEEGGATAETETPDKELPVIVNAPLDFELKGLEPNHPYLRNRGFTTETIQHFGLGYCSRGMLKDRIAIPLRDQQGRLIGYAGRVIHDSVVTDSNPRYRFPGTRIHNGQRYEFRKSELLYNWAAIVPPPDYLIVVEGFASVWWLHQNGFRNCVATMGADCSETQLTGITKLLPSSGRLWFMPDGDQSGMRFAQTFLSRASAQRFVRWSKLQDGKQPTDLLPIELRTVLAQ